MIAHAAAVLVLAGAAILVVAFQIVRRLIAQLPTGSLRNRWYGMRAMIVLFFAGYVIYVFVFWGTHTRMIDLLVPGVFFFGACFVWLTANLSLQTAMDVMKVSILERESLTDHLTRLVNRRYLERRLSEEVATARRYGRPLSIIMLDIDRFKEINDTHGHAAGDQVLVSVGEVIGAELRESDVLARFGGDEFVIIAPQTNLQRATELAERLRKRVEEHGFTVQGGMIERRELRVTISLGIGTWSGESEGADGLIRSADENLYKAKHGGRNKVSGGVSPV